MYFLRSAKMTWNLIKEPKTCIILLSCIPSVFNRITKHWLFLYMFTHRFSLLNCNWHKGFLLLPVRSLLFSFIFLLVLQRCNSIGGLQVVPWCVFPPVARFGGRRRMVVIIVYSRRDLGDNGCLDWRGGGSGFEGLLSHLKVSQPLILLHVAQVVWEEELTGPTEREKVQDSENRQSYINNIFDIFNRNMYL